jgi:hypothetical protein
MAENDSSGRPPTDEPAPLAGPPAEVEGILPFPGREPNCEPEPPRKRGKRFPWGKDPLADFEELQRRIRTLSPERVHELIKSGKLANVATAAATALYVKGWSLSQIANRLKTSYAAVEATLLVHRPIDHPLGPQTQPWETRRTPPAH